MGGRSILRTPVTTVTVTLEAEFDATGTGTETGPKSWGPHVTLQGYNLDGNPANIRREQEFTDWCIGVAGGRWRSQIDYTDDGNADPEGGRGEALDITFSVPVTGVVFTTGQADLDEGGTGVHEGLAWDGYDDTDALVASGLIFPRHSTLGANVKEPGSYGRYPVALTSATPLTRVRVRAVAWQDDAGVSYPDNNSSNGQLASNNSDVGLAALTYTISGG